MDSIMAEEVETRITVRVQPDAGKNQLMGFKDGVLQVKIAAHPVKGKANRELIRFLSDVWEVPRSSLTIEKGLTARRKVIAVRGLTQEEVISRSQMK